MERARHILRGLMHPPAWALVLVPVLSFSALTAVFACQYEDNAATYLIYCLSAYSLAVWLVALPGAFRRLKRRVLGGRLARRVADSPLAERYLGDRAFRQSLAVCRGMTMNLLYVAFRLAMGVRYGSVWFLSMAAYYLALGGLRGYLLACYRRRSPERERRCYRTTAWLLFLLNIPMGGMIVLMVRTSAAFSYPGYVIYLSALYAFYAITVSLIHLIKRRHTGSPILSAARVLDFVSAMMSILGLQTAMIARFSDGSEPYRRMMNAITGGCVYAAVILLAAYMLRRGGTKKEGERH